LAPNIKTLFPVFAIRSVSFFGKIRARDPLLERPFQYSCAVDHADAVRQDQRCVCHSLFNGAVLTADLDDFRVGGYDVSRFPARKIPFGQIKRLPHGQIIEADAQNIRSHGRCPESAFFEYTAARQLRISKYFNHTANACISTGLRASCHAAVFDKGRRLCDSFKTLLTHQDTYAILDAITSKL
jgi:hypothetical protein